MLSKLDFVEGKATLVHWLMQHNEIFKKKLFGSRLVVKN